jgi:protein subunit release factor A
MHLPAWLLSAWTKNHSTETVRKQCVFCEAVSTLFCKTKNRVTDHRINLNLYNLEKIMLGEIDELIEAMTNYGKQEKVKELAATL